MSDLFTLKHYKFIENFVPPTKAATPNTPNITLMDDMLATSGQYLCRLTDVAACCQRFGRCPT